MTLPSISSEVVAICLILLAASVASGWALSKLIGVLMEEPDELCEERKQHESK